MYVEAGSRLEDDAEVNLWTPGENLKLLRMVYQQLPVNDGIPFDERIEKINWKRVSTEERSEKEVQKQFDYLLSKIRKYRVLSELLDDLEKVIACNLPLPKKQNAFSLFIEENKDDIKKEIGRGNKKGAFVTLAAERFKQLSEKEKEKYVTRAKLIKQTHDDYFMNNNIIKKVKKKSASTSKLQSLNSPLTVFWEHKRRKDETVTLKDARQMYAALARSKKLKFILQFLGIDEGGKLNMEQYIMAEKALTKDELAIFEEYEGRPKRLSAYNIFMKDRLANKSETSMNKSSYFKTIGEEWKNLDKTERAKYEEMSKQTHDNYVQEYIEYIKSLPLDRQPFEMNRILSKKFPKRTRKASTKEDSDEEVLAVIDVKKEKSKAHKQSKRISAEKKPENDIPSFSQAFASSPKKKVKLDTSQDNFMTSIPKSVIKTELDPDQVRELHNKNKFRKTSDSVSEADTDNQSFGSPLSLRSNKKKLRKTSDSVSEADADHQITENSSILNPSQESETLQTKFPSTAFKYYIQTIFDGPKQKAKRAYKRLNFKEKEELIKKYQKAKKKYLKSVEGEFKSPLPFGSPKLSKNSFSQSEISNEEISDFASD